MSDNEKKIYLDIKCAFNKLYSIVDALRDADLDGIAHEVEEATFKIKDAANKIKENNE